MGTVWHRTASRLVRFSGEISERAGHLTDIERVSSGVGRPFGQPIRELCEPTSLWGITSPLELPIQIYGLVGHQRDLSSVHIDAHGSSGGPGIGVEAHQLSRAGALQGYEDFVARAGDANALPTGKVDECHGGTCIPLGVVKGGEEMLANASNGKRGYRSGDNCHGSSVTSYRGRGHASAAHSKKFSSASSSTVMRRSGPSTTHGVTGSYSATV
jgi:hypothetical protein